MTLAEIRDAKKDGTVIEYLRNGDIIHVTVHSIDEDMGDWRVYLKRESNTTSSWDFYINVDSLDNKAPTLSLVYKTFGTVKIL